MASFPGNGGKRANPAGRTKAGGAAVPPSSPGSPFLRGASLELWGSQDSAPSTQPGLPWDTTQILLDAVNSATDYGLNGELV